MILLLLAAFIILAVFEYNTILREKDTKTIMIYFTLFLLGFILNLLLLIDKAPISPVILIEKVVKFII